jgi:hypothetical protein
MKPNIPWTARFAAWMHEAWVGHRTEKHYSDGKYRRLRCCGCFKTFHQNRDR